MNSDPSTDFGRKVDHSCTDRLLGQYQFEVRRIGNMIENSQGILERVSASPRPRPLDAARMVSAPTLQIAESIHIITPSEGMMKHLRELKGKTFMSQEEVAKWDGTGNFIL